MKAIVLALIMTFVGVVGSANAQVVNDGSTILPGACGTAALPCMTVGATNATAGALDALVSKASNTINFGTGASIGTFTSTATDAFTIQANLHGADFSDNVALFINTTVSVLGQCGNSANSYSDGSFKGGAMGYSFASGARCPGAGYYPDSMYIETDGANTEFIIANNSAVFPLYRALRMLPTGDFFLKDHGENNKLFFKESTGRFMFNSSSDPLSTIDVFGNVAIGNYASVTAAPTGGLIVSGRAGFGTATPNDSLEVAGGGAIFNPNSIAGGGAGTQNAVNIIGSTAIKAGLKAVYSGVGAAYFGHNAANSVVGTDTTGLDFRAGITGADLSTGTSEADFNKTNPNSWTFTAGSTFVGGVTTNGLTDNSTIIANTLNVNGNTTLGSGQTVAWFNRAAMQSPADGVVELSNYAQTDFSLLQFGGGTTSFPALKRSTTRLQAVLANGSAFTLLQGKLATDTNYTAGVTVPTGYLVLYDATGTTAYKVNACTGC